MLRLRCRSEAGRLRRCCCNKMISYRLLSATDLIPLYQCFLDAFSDYQVDMQMSQQQFEQRLARDGVQLELSGAAFDRGSMVAFYMNGVGSWRGTQTAYDAGTGVVPSHRRQGIAKELFDFMVPRIKEAGIVQYLLEVLTSNHSAVLLYRKLGFVEVRSLAVLRAQEAVRRLSDDEEISIRRMEPHRELFESFWDGYPSWQNSIEAVKRVAGERVVMGAFVGEQCVGYGVVFRPTGNLMQLAVAPAFRRRGIGSRILSALTEGESLKVNNIDERLTGTLAFLEANGFQVALKQFEMSRML